MLDNYVGVLKNYVGFEGRARRREYWQFVLVNVVIAVVLAIIGAVIGTSVLSYIYTLAILLPSLAVGARRLHDTGRSGFWLFIGVIPLVGAIVLIVLTAQDSTPGPNRFGANPKGIGNPGGAITDQYMPGPGY
jgi:uncharacterized membrane protein YhaH (DUF805 family)